jgi:hypothetical protein
METYHALTSIAPSQPPADETDEQAITTTAPMRAEDEAEPTQPGDQPAAVVNQTLEELAREGARRPSCHMTVVSQAWLTFDPKFTAMTGMAAARRRTAVRATWIPERVARPENADVMCGDPLPLRGCPKQDPPVQYRGAERSQAFSYRIRDGHGAVSMRSGFAYADP